MAAASISYVTDVPYVAEFTPELSPDWLDLVATVGGFAPPNRDGHFAWCELGCGPGLTANIYAAANPDATFVGIDAMPDHIAAAQSLAAASGNANLIFYSLDFDAAAALALPSFQYIVAHGVYAWIDPDAAASLRRFIERHLAPGGLVYVSYNAMPGWAADAPFQHLVYSLAADQPGDSNHRFEVAAEMIRKLTTAGAPALRASSIARDWYRHATSRPIAYFSHEYLAPAWRPLYVNIVRTEMARVGLVPVGSATLAENFGTLVLNQAAREALQAIEDEDLRELARDYFLLQRFRRDVYGRSPRKLSEGERRDRLLAFPFGLLRPPSLVDFRLVTDLGAFTFDNRVARRIVALLADGSQSLLNCLEVGEDPQDVLANALMLCCARAIWPATAKPASVAHLNEALFEWNRQTDELAYHALPCGTALRFNRGFLAAWREASPVPPDAEPWIEHLMRCSRGVGKKA